MAMTLNERFLHALKDGEKDSESLQKALGGCPMSHVFVAGAQCIQAGNAIRKGKSFSLTDRGMRAVTVAPEVAKRQAEENSARVAAARKAKADEAEKLGEKPRSRRARKSSG